MPPFRALARIILSVALLCGTRARAQEASETIEVRGERPQGSPRAPAAQGTVIETAQYAGQVRSISELLLGSPGVSVHALGGPGQTATLSLRGASADESLVLLDGIPLSGPGGGAPDLAALPAMLLERMIVTRGVLGAQFGAGALGGAVELVPRSARAGKTVGAEVSAGSFGTARLGLDASVPVANGSALVAFQGDRTAGGFEYARQLTPEIAGSPWYGFQRQNADATRGSGLLRVTQEIGANAGMDVLMQGSMGERGLPGPASAPTPRTRELDEGGLGGVRLRGMAGPAAWSLRAFGRLDRIELRGAQAFGDCADGAPDCPRDDQRSSSGRGEAELALPAGDTQFVKLLLSGGGERVHGTETGVHGRSLLAAAVSDDLSLPGGFTLHPAVRADKAGPDSGLSPALAAQWHASPWTLRAGWGLSFRPASFTELYLDRGGVAANPDLRPERAWSLDAGAAFRKEGLRLSAGAFWSEYRDLILYQLFPPARVKPFNAGQARIAGVELQAVVPLPAHLFAELSYSFLDAVDGQRHKLAYRAPHRVFARLARHGDRVEGYAEAGFTSSMPRNAFDSAFVGSQLLLNAGAGVRAAGPLWLDVEAKNLLDNRTYEDLFQYPLPGLSIAVIARARL
ncbi:MAG TPA: TonB-dependent receptor [Myxococcales bacterium]